MGRSFYIFTTLDTAAALKLLDRYAKAEADFLADHPEVGEREEGCGDVALASAFPVDRSKHPELAACRSALEVDRPAAADGPQRLQASQLVFLLEGSGAGAYLDEGDGRLEAAASALARWRGRRPYEDFGSPSAAAAAASPPTSAHAPLSRAERIAMVLEGARDRPDAWLAARQCLSRIKGPAQSYLRVLADQGPLDDADVAAALGLSLADVNAMADRVLADLTAAVED